MASVWTLQYGEVTQDLATWGISGLMRHRKVPVECDKVTFQMPLNIDVPLPFAVYDAMTMTPAQAPVITIFENGARWFTGVVTLVKPVAAPGGESLSYEVSCIWFWLQKIIFQQQWSAIDLNGDPTQTSTTTRSEIILSQALDGFKMNSGMVIGEVLTYAQYAYQMLAYPTTVQTNHLPPPPPMQAPFIVGAVTPSITVPYSTTRDKACSEIISLMLKYSPDCVVWVDNSTAVPTLNIAQRSTLPTRSIKVFDGTVISKFAPNPRYDLQVPVVVVKFTSPEHLNGSSFDAITVQFYPPAPAGISDEVWCSQPGAWVMTIDLVGPNSTTQTADIKSIPRAIDPMRATSLDWALAKQKILISKNPSGVPLYDSGNVSLAYVNTVIDPNDPLNDPNKNPNNITLPACPQLLFELLTGDFSKWLQEDPNDLDAAKVDIEFHLAYSGSDPGTARFFYQDPSDPTAVLTAATGGVMICKWTGKITNAATNVYSQITSASAGEPVPLGFAQYLYNTLAQLHYEGTVEFSEEECSDPLPPGCTFNVMDGKPEWKNMQALVLSVVEDIDKGKTTVTFGPPLALSANALAELWRIQVGRLPAFKLQQRQDGTYQGGSNVIGSTHAADTSTTQPPAQPAGPPDPFTISSRVNPTTKAKEIKVLLNSTLYKSPSQGDNVAITGLDTWITVTGIGYVYLKGNVVAYAVSGNPTILTCLNTGGDFDPNADIWATGSVLESSGSPPVQTLFRVPIGNYDATGSKAPVITQRLKSHLILTNTPPGGFPAIYPLPLT